ncbi:MAG: sigma-E factor negative regulatory protein [Cocleimonas sp.]|nr:sigma-E factor negative regulatory protein [Cocleimonas sp.]
MSVTIAEHLSSVLDGEAGEFEQRRILDELGKDDELQSSLSCYALIGETMRDERQSCIADSSFLKGIHDEIEAEPDYSHVQVIEKKVSNGSSLWSRPITGFAMAASVAAVSVIGVQGYMLTGNANPVPIVATQQAKAVPTVVAANSYSHPDAKTRSLYKRYLNSHVQHASTTPIMPSVRMVSYNANY